MATTPGAGCFILRDMGKKQASESAVEIQPLPMLRVIRKATGKSQQWLGDQVGLTKASISRIEAGEQNWDAAFLHKAARALQVDPTDLLTPRPPEEIAWTLAGRGLGPNKMRAAIDLVEVLKRTGSED